MFPMSKQRQMCLSNKEEIPKVGLAYCWEGLFLQKKMSLQKYSYFQNLAGIEPFQLPYFSLLSPMFYVSNLLNL